MSVPLQADNAMLSDFGMIRALKLMATTPPSSPSMEMAVHYPGIEFAPGADDQSEQDCELNLNSVWQVQLCKLDGGP